MKMEQGEQTMKPTKLTITICMLALLLLGGCSNTQTSESSQTAKPLVFGVVLPLTGTNAFYGAFTKAGAKLAVEEINKAGGVDGRVVKAIYEDAPDKTAATTAAKKLIELDGADALFAMLTPMAGSKRTCG